jgi:hypothetical protein
MAMFIVKPWYRKKDAIYGAEWAGTSDPSWVRTDAAVGFSNPNPYYSGMSGSPSSPFDNIMPWSGMRRVTDASAGELVEIPKFYYKLSQPNGVGLKVQISMSQFDGSYVDPMHMDRGDGVGEREYAYIGRYHCSSSNYKSATGVAPKADITRATARTAIHNLGSNIYQMDFATRFTLWLLYLVEFANWNSQAMIGYGCGNNSSTENMGYTDTMPYHTGTTASSRTTYGGAQYRYIEGLWDNVYDLVDGIVFSSSNVYVTSNPNNFGDTTANHTLVGTRSASNGYISAWNVYNNPNEPWAIYPSSVRGSDTTYVCDYYYYYSGGVVLYAGGGYTQSQKCGLFYLGGDSPISDLSTQIGTRLMVLPPSRLSA